MRAERLDEYAAKQYFLRLITKYYFPEIEWVIGTEVPTKDYRERWYHPHVDGINKWMVLCRPGQEPKTVCIEVSYIRNEILQESWEGEDE